MDSVLAKAVGEGECAPSPVRLRLLRLVAIVEVKPHLLFRGPQVCSADLLERLVDPIVAQLHGLEGIGTECYSSADFAKCLRLLINGDGDLPAVKGNCYCDSCNSAAD